MMELTYNYELAYGAQLWANQCLFKHDARATCKHSWIGQNLYRGSFRGEPSDPKGDMKKGIDAWYTEVTFKIIGIVLNNEFLLYFKYVSGLVRSFIQQNYTLFLLFTGFCFYWKHR